jgi:uncharacterized protein YbaA (DUF1428 family)
MAKYTDVYLLPVKQENIEAYREMAEKAGKLFRKHGALTYREYVASDLKAMEGITAFPNVVKLEAGETLVYAAVEFESERHRNESMERLFEDPEMHAIMPKEPLFDMKRMVYGGFAILVEV